MEIFTNLWNSWATYEKILLGILLLIIILVIPTLVWIFTKNKQLSLVSLFSILISGFIVCLTFLVANLLFSVIVTDIFKIVPFIAIFTTTLSIGTTVGYFMQNHKRKDFSILEIKTEVRNDTIRLSVSLLLLLIAVAVLSPSLILPLLLALGDSLITIWLTYILVYKLVK